MGFYRSFTSQSRKFWDTENFRLIKLKVKYTLKIKIIGLIFRFLPLPILPRPPAHLQTTMAPPLPSKSPSSSSRKRDTSCDSYSGTGEEVGGVSKSGRGVGVRGGSSEYRVRKKTWDGWRRRLEKEKKAGIFVFLAARCRDGVFREELLHQSVWLVKPLLINHFTVTTCWDYQSYG